MTVQGNILPSVELKGIQVVLGGRKVLEVPALKVRRNEVLIAIGPNGSGKTTLLMCLALLLKPAVGTVIYDGEEVRSGASILRLRRNLAVVFQEPLLLAGTVWHNVTLGLRLRGVDPGEADARAETWLRRFGVLHLAKRQARTLSGGEAQRTSLARAFALQPRALFLDEPFAALDPPTRSALTQDFQKVLSETRITTVMVTHDRNEALALADRVAVVMEGRILQTGTPGEVFSSPVNEAVAAFVGVENILHGVVKERVNGVVSVSAGAIAVQAIADMAPGCPVTVLLRPEDITLSLPRDAGTSSARNQLRGKVVRMDSFGAQARVTVDCGAPLVSLITRRSYEDMGLEIGREVVASFKASSVHLIAGR